MVEPSIADVRRLAEQCSNWGRWGSDDELGTLNLLTQDNVLAGKSCIRRGMVFSLAVPYDSSGPQMGGWGRFNPIHLMMRDGNDAVTGTTVRDFYGGKDGYVRGTDDLIIMPLQCGTQWDALAHMVFEGKIYNGYDATQVSSLGALRNDIAKAREKLVGRGVLLDVARWKGKPWLDGGEVITGDDLAACAAHEGVEIGRGDIVLVRTGQIGMVRHRGDWGDYAAGYSARAPGLGLDSVPWIRGKDIAALATDTWGAEVLPNETADVSMPLHILLIVKMGLTLGEIFDLEALAEDCARDGVYEFFFAAPPLPITRAVGTPVNPVAVK
ncbi:MAG: cyclase family protein [Nitriliruptorales bacterium]|nr:cyclase family protein [Nitriliruptorales bacterium]